MAQKNAKIDDVKRPEKVTPSATSRPILVSGQASAPADPMMVPAGGDTPEGEAVQVMNHSAKTIMPPSELTAQNPIEDEPKPATDSEEKAEPAAETASTAVAEKPAETKPEKPAETPPEAPAEPEPSDRVTASVEDRDPDAALSAEESAAVEARVKREAELEELITSGKYAVPIDAVQRRRSRMHTIILGLLALLLAVALIDVITDAGIIDLPSSVPHTHFFSGH